MPDILVERLQTYTEQDTADLGVLRNVVSPKRSRDQLTEERMRIFTDHPDRLLVVARATETGRIIGGETLVKVPVLEAEDDDPDGFAWLGFVSTLPTERGKGIAKAVTLEGATWCLEQGIDEIKFTSNSHNPERESARSLYLKYGATIVAAGTDGKTDLFSWKVSTAIDKLTASPNLLN
jgi:GNAT superfamily N-acetyltransferase